MGFGVGGGMDERNEDHKWVWDEFLRLDEELNAIRAKFLTEEEINKMETKNLKKVFDPNNLLNPGRFIGRL